MLRPDPLIFLSLLTFLQIIGTSCQPEPVVNIETVSLISERPVKELDALQSASGAMLVASMERSASGIPEHICSVYRSTDQGKNWDLVLTLDDTSNYTRQYADPRLVEDPQSGKVYLVVMQVRLPEKHSRANKYRRDYYLGDISVYRSDNDGKDWEYQSSPHVDPTGLYGDLPFPLVDRQACLWIFHSKLDIRRLIAPSEMVVHRSCDGGVSWSESYTFSDSLIASSRKNLGNLVVKDERTLAGTFTDQEQLYYFELDYSDQINLKNIAAIPISFGETIIPIAYLHRQQDSGDLGIVSYLPHQPNSSMWYSGSTDGGISWNAHKINIRGSYPNVRMKKDGKVLITFNHRNGKFFQLMYTISKNNGQNFGASLPLYEGKFRFSESGEYQALFLDHYGRENLIFCDWSDYSRAKHTRLSTDPDF